jgi:uncharacterized protein (TIGR02996 family)
MSKRGLGEFWRPTSPIVAPDFSILKEMEEMQRKNIQDAIMSQYREPEPYFDDPAFIAAIRANPDDDTVRLAYADYLEESGQGERAAFIRGQIELEAIRRAAPHLRPPETIKLPKMAGRGRQLTTLADRFQLIVHEMLEGTPWGLTKDGFRGGQSCTISRGFLDSGTCSSADWIRLGDATLAKHPVRKLVWTDLPWVIDPQISLAHLRWRWPGVEFEIRDMREAPIDPYLAISPDLLRDAGAAT